MKKWTGNRLKKETESGKQVWYWEDKIGSQCGQDRKWRYEVLVGDVVIENVGICPDGSFWSEMTISGEPEQVSN